MLIIETCIKMSVHSILYSTSRQREKRVPLMTTLKQLGETDFVRESQFYLAKLFNVLEEHLTPV